MKENAENWLRNLPIQTLTDELKEDIIEQFEEEPKVMSYVIVDENNRWHSTGYNMTQEDIDQDVKDIRKRLKEDGYKDIHLFLYEITGSPKLV